MGTLNLGIAQASLATAFGYLLVSIPRTLYFLFNRKRLHFRKPLLKIKAVLKAMGTGSYEIVGNLVTAVTTLIFNSLMLKLVGNDGVVAMSVILYCQYLFNSLFMGYSIDIAPVISYRFGASDEKQVKHMTKVSYIFIAITSFLVTCLTMLLSNPLANLFSNNNEVVRNLTSRGLKLFSIGFLLTRSNIFSSAFFTALSDGVTSAILSFMRTFVFIITNTYLLSYFFNVTCILLAIPVAEVLTMTLNLLIFKTRYKKRK